VLIFRETSFLKKQKQVEKTIIPNADPAELGKLLGVKNLKIYKTEGDTIYFELVDTASLPESQIILLKNCPLF